MPEHCANRPYDRVKGFGREREFKRVVDAWGYPCELHPADLSLWVDARVWPYPTLHEIKGKTPTRRGCFGLEAYRLDELLKFDTRHPTFYTIHNDAVAGVDAWVTARVSRLPRDRQFRARFPSYHGSEVQDEDGFFWPVSFFDSLAGWLAP